MLFFLKPWKNAWTKIADKKDTSLVIIIGSLFCCHFYIYECLMWYREEKPLEIKAEVGYIGTLMLFICWIAESYFKRISVLVASLFFGWIGTVACLVVTLLGVSSLSTMNIELYLIRVLIACIPLYFTTIVTHGNIINKFIVFENFLFFVIWFSYIGSFIISVIINYFETSKYTAVAVLGFVTGLTSYELLMTSVFLQIFKPSYVVFNIHYLILKLAAISVLSSVTPRKKPEVQEEQAVTAVVTESSTNKTVNLAVVEVIYMLPFLCTFCMFLISYNSVRYVVVDQLTYTYITYPLVNFNMTTWTELWTVISLPIVHLYLLPLCNRLRCFISDLSKLGLSFILLAISIVFCCAVQYLIIKKRGPFTPKMFTQLNFVNDLDTPTFLKWNVFNATIPPHKMRLISKDLTTIRAKWSLDVINVERGVNIQLELTDKIGENMLCILSEFGLICKRIFSTKAWNHDLALLSVVNTVGESTVLLIDPLTNLTISLMSYPQKIITKLVTPKSYDMSIIHPTGGKFNITDTRNISLPQSSVHVIYISKFQNLSFEVILIANPRVVPDWYVWPSIVFIGLSYVVAIFYAFRHCYRKGPLVILATTFALAFLMQLCPQLLVQSQAHKSSVTLALLVRISMFHLIFAFLFLFIQLKYSTISNMEPLSKKQDIPAVPNENPPENIEQGNK